MSKTRVGLSANQISDKWGRKMKSSISDIQTGIDGVTESPTEKAAAKKDKMIQNLNAAINNGRWENGLRNVTLADWKSKTKTKVAERMSSGVDAGMGKRQKFDAHNVATLNAILPEINSMPDMTLQDSINRVAVLMKHMADNPFKG